MKSIISKLIISGIIGFVGAIVLNKLGLPGRNGPIYILIIAQISLLIPTIDILKNSEIENMNKAIWAIVILLFPIFGPITCSHINDNKNNT